MAQRGAWPDRMAGKNRRKRETEELDAGTDSAEGDTGVSSGTEPAERTGGGEELKSRSAQTAWSCAAGCEPEADPAGVTCGQGFAALGLRPEVLRAVQEQGFEVPTPIQERAVPVMLAGRDMIGQAQTGTGKTAAFALPVLSRIDCGSGAVQALVLEPTRELALQVAEACQGFARHLDGFRVAPVYGGASYENQIRSLRHGAQLVTGTPGRLMDLIRRGVLDLGAVRHLVIDEADEMLRMGFIDDVNWILSRTPEVRQTVLFSATMPPAVARIAREHLDHPEEVRIMARTTTATTVRQRYWVVSGAHKIDAMTRILEVESYGAVLVFVRTKTDVEEVATRLTARGLACAALHGDIPQRQREKLVERLRNGSLDILIATDVAARGLDVDRITHVFNYDIPHDVESYVHRIGRTGRAGRTGEAILFVAPRERWALRQIERVTRQRIEPMRLPTAADVNRVRLAHFRDQVLETIEQGGLERYVEVISELLADDAIEPELLAAALARMCQPDGGLLLDESQPEPDTCGFAAEPSDSPSERGQGGRCGKRSHRGPAAEARPLRGFPDLVMQRYRLSVGRRDGVTPVQIVEAVTRTGHVDSRHIGEIALFDTFAVVDLPRDLSAQALRALAEVRVEGRALCLRRYAAEPPRKHPKRPVPRPARHETGPHARQSRERSSVHAEPSGSRRRERRKPSASPVRRHVASTSSGIAGQGNPAGADRHDG